MISGTLAVLEAPRDDLLESTGGSGGFTTLEVSETLEGFDDHAIQHGRACSTIETQTEEIHVDNEGCIDVESVGGMERVWTSWVADVTDAGFIAAERTHGDEFPWNLFAARAQTSVDRVEIDVGAIISRFRDRDREVDVWMVGRDAGGAEMRYHSNARSADAAQADIGVGFELPWNGTTVKGVMYRSGYLAVFSEGWGPRKYASFVRDVVLPYAEVPEDDEETEQVELDDSGGDFADEVASHLEDEGLDVEQDAEVTTDDAEEDDETEEEACDECGSVPEKYGLHDDAGDRVCIVCKDHREEQRAEVVEGGED